MIYPKVGVICLKTDIDRLSGGCSHLMLTYSILTMPRLMYFFFVVYSIHSDLPSIVISASKVKYRAQAPYGGYGSLMSQGAFFCVLGMQWAAADLLVH